MCAAGGLRAATNASATQRSTCEPQQGAAARGRTRRPRTEVAAAAAAAAGAAVAETDPA